MLKKFLNFALSFLIMSFRLMASDHNQIQTVIYLVPSCACEYVTQGNAYHLSEGRINAYPYKRRDLVAINYFYERELVSCYFGSPTGEILRPGIYKNAHRFSVDHTLPLLDCSGFSRGYNQIQGEFEIFEIDYDEKGNLLTFAADFNIHGYNKESILRGSVRFNSNYPIDEYFIKMTDPAVNWESSQIAYVQKHDIELPDETRDILVIDKKEISITLKENNGFDLEVKEFGNCCKNKQINFHIPNLFHMDENNSYIITPKLNYEDNYESSGDEYEYFFGDKGEYISEFNIESRPSITLGLKNGLIINSSQGIFTISDFVFDIKNNKIISLAIDFSFEDEYHDSIYDGCVRYHSKIPVYQQTQVNLPYQN